MAHAQLEAVAAYDAGPRWSTDHGIAHCDGRAQPKPEPSNRATAIVQRCDRIIEAK